MLKELHLRISRGSITGITVFLREMEEKIITVFHLAASELFNAIKFIAASPPKASHVIACSFALTPTLSIERNRHVFIVAVRISIWMILRTTAFGFFDLMQMNRITYSDAVQVVAVRAERPAIIAAKDKRNSVRG